MNEFYVVMKNICQTEKLIYITNVLKLKIFILIFQSKKLLPCLYCLQHVEKYQANIEG